MEKSKLSLYWNDIPVGKENALKYERLCDIWGCEPRKARAILHELSLFDNGDNYILIRSSNGNGFYKTDNEAEITAFKKECLNKGRSIFAPLKKINRVLMNNSNVQCSLDNNLRIVRESCGMKQSEVCAIMKTFDKSFDNSLLSKMENGVCIPTYTQLSKLADIFRCEPSELISVEFILLNT